MKTLFVTVFSAVFCCMVCRELHTVLPNSDKCFDTYTDIQPINLSNLTKACVGPIPDQESCQGLSLVTDEIILLECNDTDAESIKPLKKGCYRIIKQDGIEDVVCQKFKKRNLCEIIKTPANLIIEVYCYRSARGIVNVKNLKIIR